MDPLPSSISVIVSTSGTSEVPLQINYKNGNTAKAEIMLASNDHTIPKKQTSQHNKSHSTTKILEIVVVVDNLQLKKCQIKNLKI